MDIRLRAGWLLVAAALAGGLSRCDCQDSGGMPCAIDADCPDGMVCRDGTCRPDVSPDGEDGLDQDGFTRPDRGDLGGYDGGGWVECDGPADCEGDQVCFNGLCVTVIPAPDCADGDDDACINDTYCEPELDGCVPWEAHPEPLPDCEHIPPEGEFTPVEEWVWDSPLEAPEWNEVMMTPVVVDLAGRGGGDVFSVPAVVFNSFRRDRGYTQDGVLRAVDGAGTTTTGHDAWWTRWPAAGGTFSPRSPMATPRRTCISPSTRPTWAGRMPFSRTWRPR